MNLPAETSTTRVSVAYIDYSSGAGADQIATHLANVQTMMGLDATADQCLRAAEKLAAIDLQMSAPPDGRA